MEKRTVALDLFLAAENNSKKKDNRALLERLGNYSRKFYQWSKEIEINNRVFGLAGNLGFSKNC
jgi:hypothetical protein